MIDQKQQSNTLKNELKRLNEAAHQNIMNKIKRKVNYSFEIA